MTTVVSDRDRVADLLAPITAALRSVTDTTDLPGLAPGLLIPDGAGWLPATTLVNGSRLPDLLEAAQRRWQASPHAAAALAWKRYSYWLALPAVLGWASARRVPLLRPADVLIHLRDQRQLLALGLRQSVTVAVLPSDPLARSNLRQVTVADNDSLLLAALRESLLDAHLNPLADAIRAQVRLGARILRGSISSGVARGILRASDTLPGSTIEEIETLLTALEIEDLVELEPGPDGELTVRRKTCCLAFTLPQPRVCAGCCIEPGAGG